MKTAILSVGTELLLGETQNTNTTYLSQELKLLGFDVLYHFSVGDNPKRLHSLLEYAFSHCDLVVTTGGLGPTQDDLTKETIADFFQTPLVRFKEEEKTIEKFFDKIQKKMSENNRKQADFPQNALIFPNQVGTAPGFSLEKEGKAIIALPGPPKEMKSVFYAAKEMYLQEKMEGVLYFTDVRTFGIGESSLETLLLPVIDGQTDPTIATYAKEGECLVRVASKQPTKVMAQEKVDAMVERIKELIGPYIYSTQGKKLSQVVCEKLLEQSISISVAESCTGGLFASSLVDYPGISRVFQWSTVTYSNESKERELFVPKETIESCGAVSKATAKAMVEGLWEKSESNLCVAITGIAGPTGDRGDKVPGKAHIALLYQKENQKLFREVVVETHHRNRSFNRNYFVLSMFYELSRFLDQVKKKGGNLE